METLQMIVQRGTARKPLTLPWSFYVARSLLSFINAVLNATSKELKTAPKFQPFGESHDRGFQKVPL